MLTAGRLPLDASSPVPLYHQIAEALRYRIATGVLAPAELLPPLREAAAHWGVNLHTVRRAYAELTEQGVTETNPPLGTRVLAGAARRASARSEAERTFLAGVVREARERHGLSIDRLVAALEHVGASSSAGAAVSVIECSEVQANDLAHQLQARWQVDALPFSLERPEEPPPGPLVATYFHYNDLRARCPRRLASVRFMAIRPDPALADHLAAAAGRRRRPLRVTLCERDAAMASNIAADLATILPAADFTLSTEVTRAPARLLDHRAGGPLLFSPRVWGELGPEQRSHPRAFEVRYLFDPADLEAVGRDLNWAAR